MENKKKMIFNVLFLFLVFAATLYGVFHGEDLSEIAEILKTVNLYWLLPGVACVIIFIWGESIIIFYMMHTLVFGQVMRFTTTVARSPIRRLITTVPIKWQLFLCRILFQLYHAIRNRRTAGADLLYEERENSNPGINTCADDCHDYI